MITSALISQCRREFGDVPKLTRISRQGNASINQFNTGRKPIIEGSYSIYVSGVAKNENSDYTIDLDSGDIAVTSTPGNGIEVRADLKYANWRDKNWLEVINDGISDLNARGFFRQVSRATRYISANNRSQSGPSACIDLYEVLYYPTAQTLSKLPFNWSYQQDSNKLVLGSSPTAKLSGVVSYLRNLQTYTATSATLDVKDDWIPLIKKYAGHRFYSHMAGKIATQGNASVEDGHFSFTSLRTQGRDLLTEYSDMAMRKKPTRPAKDIQFSVDGTGSP